MDIKEVTSLTEIKPQLIELLVDCVDSGASVGFLPPLSEVDAEHYWAGVNADIQDKACKLLVAIDGNKLIGAVQLAVTKKPNGSHRGEVEKLMVHTSARGKGTGKLLMKALEDKALNIGQSLLVLDTRLGDAASDLYRKVGYVEVGRIPEFARGSNGQLEATVFFYKLLA